MKKIRSYTSIWSVEKVLYSINDFRLPFPITFTQMTWFVVSLFAVMILGNLPPLSMIEEHFSNTLGFLWLSHGLCLQKLLMVKALWIFEVCHCLCTATKADLCRKKVTLGRNQPQEAITAVRVNFMAYPIKYIENNLVWNKDGNVMLTMSLFLTITHF